MGIIHYPPTRELTAGLSTAQSLYFRKTREGPGFKMLDPNTNSCVQVPPVPNAYVVNTGDLLGSWTSGTYVSSMHRGIHRSLREHYRIVCFFDGNLDNELRALNGPEI